MGVLTHLDEFTDAKKLRSVKKSLKARHRVIKQMVGVLTLLQHRFWTEIYNGAKLFYISGMMHGRYNKRDTHNLARFISIAKARPPRSIQHRQMMCPHASPFPVPAAELAVCAPVRACGPV